MKIVRSTLLSAALGGAVLASGALPAAAFCFLNCGPTQGPPQGKSAPGPLVGEGLPFVIVGLGAIWLWKRRRQSV
jgi:hypothetical protein